MATSIPRGVNVIESEASPRILSRFNERLSDVRAAFALFVPAVRLSITAIYVRNRSFEFEAEFQSSLVKLRFSKGERAVKSRPGDIPEVRQNLLP